MRGELQSSETYGVSQVVNSFLKYLTLFRFKLTPDLCRCDNTIITVECDFLQFV